MLVVGFRRVICLSVTQSPNELGEDKQDLSLLRWDGLKCVSPEIPTLKF